MHLWLTHRIFPRSNSSSSWRPHRNQSELDDQSWSPPTRSQGGGQRGIHHANGSAWWQAPTAGRGILRSPPALARRTSPVPAGLKAVVPDAPEPSQSFAGRGRTQHLSSWWRSCIPVLPRKCIHTPAKEVVHRPAEEKKCYLAFGRENWKISQWLKDSHKKEWFQLRHRTSNLNRSRENELLWKLPN